MRIACLLLLLPLFFASKEAISQDQVEQTELSELKILSWNIYMLPRFVLLTGKRKRSKKIPEAIGPEGYDIIVFQEAFHSRTRKILWDRLSEDYPYEYGPANNKKTPVVTNSGIWVLSKIPLLELGTIDFKKCHLDDCFARKGALLLEGQWGENSFQILGTHLEAGPNKVKSTQYPEIAQLLDRHQKEGVPQFLCGDFNTSSFDTAQYQEMLNVLEAENGELLSIHQSTVRDGQDEIDYILLRNDPDSKVNMDRFIRIFHNQWKDEKYWLSDHHALEAIVTFN